MKMQTTILIKSIFFNSSLFLFLLIISSCCIFESSPPDLRITDQDFPSTANVNQSFELSFTIGNHTEDFLSSDCDAEKSTQGSVNLKMVNRKTGHLQVDNTQTLNPLEYNSSQTFTFGVIIGPEGAGIYDMTFLVTNFYIHGNTSTGVIVVN